MTLAHLTIEGSTPAGFWVNLSPGILRLSPVFPTAEAAEREIPYHARTCGLHDRVTEQPFIRERMH